MIVVDVDSASLARLRLTPSPAQELVSWLRLTASRRRHPLYGDPGAAARSALFDRDVALTAKVLTTDGYVPDLLTPKPPEGNTRTLDDQLAVVAETPAEEVVWQCNAHRSRANRLSAKVRSAAESGEFGRRAARGMRVFWTSAVADGWTALRATLEADIDRRSRELARTGCGHLLNTLHPRLRWRGDSIEVSKPYEVHTRLSDADLVLAPSALGWPSLAVQLINPADSVISYPVGQAGGRAEARTTGGSGVRELVGPSRARLLRHLADPCSTSELSARTGLAPATVSHHLSVLLRSGLLVRQRNGRTVLYRRNERGDTLVAQGSTA
ncbi:MAG: helix-turn-helix domain-containing protein [Propionibacteriales bacterium]|nr:helix-turn-helix domain-containing protein [Propionibacteriales bacterium]